MTKEAAECLNLASFTRMRDNGGLLYPSSVLYTFVVNLENAFTECFSLLELHSDSVLDVLDHIKRKQKIQLGCQDHCEQVAAEVTAFYITTRLHFFTKSLNQASIKRREGAKHLKLSRC